jgi:hypothetical protein
MRVREDYLAGCPHLLSWLHGMELTLRDFRIVCVDSVAKNMFNLELCPFLRKIRWHPNQFQTYATLQPYDSHGTACTPHHRSFPPDEAPLYLIRDRGPARRISRRSFRRCRNDGFRWKAAAEVDMLNRLFLTRSRSLFFGHPDASSPSRVWPAAILLSSSTRPLDSARG